MSKGDVGGPVCSLIVWENGIVITGQTSSKLTVIEIPSLKVLEKLQLVGGNGVISSIQRTKRGKNEVAISTFDGLCFEVIQSDYTFLK